MKGGRYHVVAVDPRPSKQQIVGGVTVNHVTSDLSLQIPCLALETNLAEGSLRVGIVPKNSDLGVT